MSQEILEKLDELKAGQDVLRDELAAGLDGLRVEVLGAIGQSNEAITAAISGLRVSLKDTRDKLRAVSG